MTDMITITVPSWFAWCVAVYYTLVFIGGVVSAYYKHKLNKLMEDCDDPWTGW